MILLAIQGVLLLGISLAFIRMLRGPHILDRVLALDLASLGILAVLVIEGARTGQPAYLDVAIVIALLTFIGTIAFARHAEGQ